MLKPTAMTPPSAHQRQLFQLCLSEMTGKVPRLREALTQCDTSVVRELARDLRNTVGLLGLPQLFQLSQDIEYGHDETDLSLWRCDCDRFCDLLERVLYSLRERLDEN